MNEKRLGRINHEIRRVVSSMLSDGLKDPRIHPMTSITRVRVTNDLSFANIYVSVLGSEEEKQDTVDALNKAKGFIRRTISAEVDLRHTPEPVIKLDTTIEDADTLQNLIRKVRAEDEMRNELNDDATDA